MRVRDWLIAVLAAAGVAGAVGGVLIAPAGASPAPVTLGSTTGTPSMNICGGGQNCTYVPFQNLGAAALVVPADGTLTSFSVRSGSATGSVALRVLRPAGGGAFTGAGTSPAKPLSGSLDTFAVNLPVKAGDVLGLDNSSSALLFDNTDSQPIAGYELPALADGSTSVPNRSAGGLRLLLSAVEQPSGTTTTTSSSTTTTVTTTRTVTAGGRAPSLSSVKQSAATWRESGKVLRHHPPVGTTFSFRVSAPATVTITFFAGNRARGRLVVHPRAGVTRVAFRGGSPRLRSGSYVAVFLASDSAGRASAPAALTFTIVK